MSEMFDIINVAVKNNDSNVVHDATFPAMFQIRAIYDSLVPVTELLRKRKNALFLPTFPCH